MIGGCPAPDEGDRRACEEVGAKLHILFDGELASDEAEAVLDHLERCPACRTHLGDLERIDAPLRASEPPPVSDKEWSCCWGVVEAAIAAEESSEVVRPAPPATPARRSIAHPAAPAPRTFRAPGTSGAERTSGAADESSLVRVLLPLAAGLLVLVTTFGAFVATAHATAAKAGAERVPAARVALLGFGPTDAR